MFSKFNLIAIARAGIFVVGWAAKTVQDGKVTWDELLDLGLGVARTFGIDVKPEWNVTPEKVEIFQAADALVNAAAKTLPTEEGE